MKPFILSLLLCLCALCACKKEQTNKTISVQVTNVSSKTSFNFALVDANSGSPFISVTNSSLDTTYATTVRSGEKLLATWIFTTQGQQYGQGNITISEGGQALFNINGGYSIANNFITVP